MTTQEALDHYGGYKGLAKALDIWPQAIYKWGEHPPRSKQFELQVLSDNKLKVEGGFIDGVDGES